MRKILLLIAMLTFWSSRADAQGLALDPYDAVQHVQRREADDWLKNEISASHGDFSKDRYLFVFAFNTIQADRNKLGMTAMRRLAFSLLNNSLAPGDQVLPAAWEVDLWDIGNSPISLDTGTQGRAQLVQGLQTTHSGKWKTNHDINRSFVSLARRLAAMGAPMDSTIILMFTDSGSISGTNEEIWGMLHPAYLQALQQYGFRDRVDNGFPCLSSHDNIRLNVGVAGFFPKQLKSLPGGGNGRFPTYALETWQPKEDRPFAGEPVPNPTVDTRHATTPPPPSTQSSSRSTVLGLIALLIAVVVVGAYVSRRMATATPVPVVTPVTPPTALLVLAVTLGQNARRQTLSIPVGRKAWWQIARSAADGTLGVLDRTELDRTEAKDAPEPPVQVEATPLVDLTIDAEGALLLTAAPGCKIDRPSGSFEAVGVDTSRYTFKLDSDGYFYLKADILNDPKRIELAFHKEDSHADIA